MKMNEKDRKQYNIPVPKVGHVKIKDDKWKSQIDQLIDKQMGQFKPTVEKRVSEQIQEKLKAKRDKEFLDKINGFVDHEINIQKRTLDSKVQLRVNESLRQYKRKIGPEVEQVISKKLDNVLVPVQSNVEPSIAPKSDVKKAVKASRQPSKTRNLSLSKEN